jgi:signal transduction histidine kinase
MYRGDRVGELLLCPRRGEAAFSKADRRLLEDLARQAGVVAYAVRAANEIRRARERLVVAREEERRRLRRDLHDGLGPSLASMALMADAALNLFRENPDRTAELLQEVSSEAKAATWEVRRLVYQLRPPALDELGLVGALHEHVERCRAGMNISISAPASLEPMPAAVEVAAYRIVQEAVTNVVRHSRAQWCEVKLTANGQLLIEVADDGCGIGTARLGVGLTSMRERAEELGGMCSVEPRTAGGTLVRAKLPLLDG